MVLIPAGSFEMGDHFREMSWCLPIHRVKLNSFYMDVHEVTVGQYKKFLTETEHQQPNWNGVNIFSPTDDHPMIWISWNDATAYAKWAGKRLPTEAEWEYAARGGLIGKKYPWGNLIDKEMLHYRSDFEGAKAIGSYPANGYGLHDMAGNVWEWCADWYTNNYYNHSPLFNPLGPNTGNSPDSDPIKVLRGGSWYNGEKDQRVARRYYRRPKSGEARVGFRCVLSEPDTP